jgi:Family of unknown function (DUF6247)
MPMTAPQARPPKILPRPACTPAAVRAVLAANAGDAVLRRYDQDLDMAFEQARAQGDLTPLVQTVRRWWFEADAWCDPEGQREFLARVDTYRSEGPPPAEQRMTREEVRSRFGV